MKMKTHTLQDRERFYELFFDNSLDGLAYCQMLFDTQGQPIDFIYLEVNKNFEKLTGLRNAAGKKVTELIPEITTSNPELFEIYGKVSLSGKPERFETYVEPLVRWFLVSVYSPKKKFFVAAFQNITDQKKTGEDLENARVAARNVLEDLQVEKENLAEAKAKDEALLGSIGDGVIATDEKGNIALINKSAEKLLGLKNEEIIEKSLFEAISIEDEKGIPIPLQKRPVYVALSAGTTTTGLTYFYVRKDKAKFPVTITVTPVKMDNKIVGAIQVFRDITREREIDKAKSEFVSLASHELRTPLTAIDGLVSMILDEEFGPVNTNLKQPLEDINTSSERLIHLVNDLLNLSRIQAGRLKYNLSYFSIFDTITEVIKILSPLAQEKKLKLQIGTVDKIIVQADRDKIEEIFDNVIGNSLKFTVKGSITISTKIMVDKIEVYIEDTGIGIAKEDLAKLFGQFQQIESSRGPAGTGLGLYISREIARKMGGDVWLEKSTIGIGSTFAFSLPLAKSQLAVKVKEEIEKEAKEYNPIKNRREGGELT